jgi:hypothetical protein
MMRLGQVQAPLQGVGEGDVVKFFRVGIFLRIGVVDSVHLGSLEDGIGADFIGAQGGGRVVEKNGLPVPATKRTT